MKRSINALACYLIASSSFAGSMGDINDSSGLKPYYLGLSGGYANANYQDTYTEYRNSLLFKTQVFDNSLQSGYGQIALGKKSEWNAFLFDQQIVISKLGGYKTITTEDVAGTGIFSQWTFSQSVDFGYDWMPKLSLHQNLEAYGILGAHYARFIYKKAPVISNPTSTEFNIYKDQIGFNLGAGLLYHINPSWDVGIKYSIL